MKYFILFLITLSLFVSPIKAHDPVPGEVICNFNLYVQAGNLPTSVWFYPEIKGVACGEVTLAWKITFSNASGDTIAVVNLGPGLPDDAPFTLPKPVDTNSMQVKGTATCGACGRVSSFVVIFIPKEETE